MTKSKISWTNRTWNPVTGCTKVSAGCKNCYAERGWKRLASMHDAYKGRAFTDVQCHPDRLDQPLRWSKSSLVFVNSMSDLFHPDVPFEFISRVLDTVRLGDWHTFQVLTKRPEKVQEFNNIMDPGFIKIKNLWMGVSVENQENAHRLSYFKTSPFRTRFVSIEPILGPIQIPHIDQLDWVIVGDESGPRRRPADLDWVRGIRDQCISADVPLFFKQWHVDGKKTELPELDGKIWMQYPEGK